jgi:hypothetical protein
MPARARQSLLVTVLLLAVFVAIGAAVVLAITRGGSSSATGAGAGNAKSTAGQSTMHSGGSSMGTSQSGPAMLVGQADRNLAPRYRVNLQSCAASHGTLTCTGTLPKDVTFLKFVQYNTKDALYRQYRSEYSTLLPYLHNQFGTSTHCNGTTSGEAAWLHQKAPNAPVRQRSESLAARRTDPEVFGSVFCGPTSVPVPGSGISTRTEVLVWTVDDQRILGIVTGDDHQGLFRWWYEFHHHFGMSM